MSDNMPALPYCCDVVDNIIIIIKMFCEEKNGNVAHATVGEGGISSFYAENISIVIPAREMEYRG